MDLYRPFESKWFLGTALAVFVAGLVVLSKDRMPVLAASEGAMKTALAVDADVRDAVASPALPMGTAGGLSGALGAAALSRAAHNPSILNRLKEAVTLRLTSGRAVFGSKRVISDQVKPGVPEPGLSPVPDQPVL